VHTDVLLPFLSSQFLLFPALPILSIALSLFSRTGRTTRATDSSSSWRRCMLQSAPPSSSSGCHRPTARSSCTPSFTVLLVVSERSPTNLLPLVSAGNWERAADRTTTKIRGLTDRARSGGPDAGRTALGGRKEIRLDFFGKATLFCVLGNLSPCVCRGRTRDGEKRDKISV
jgi:hypothetical protein